MKALKVLYAWAVVGTFVFVLAGCTNKDEEERMNQMRAETRQQLEEAVNQVDRSMDQMRNDLVNAQPAVKDSIQNGLDDLQKSRTDLSEKLNDLNTVTAEEWADFRREVNDAIRDVNETIMKMRGETQGVIQ